MSVILPGKATQPTFYFIGVTTTKSSIMKVFPRWAKEALGLEDAVIKGIDIEIHADPKDYIDVVDFIKNDELSLGALVTTHKLDLFEATEDMFDYLDPHAKRFRELSCISKRNGELRGHAKDPISSGLTMENFIPAGFWEENKGEVFIMGAGGSALAISSHLTREKFKDDVPSKIVIANRSQPRLDAAKEKLIGINDKVRFEYLLGPTPEDNDGYLSDIKPYSLVINATGLGKDRPGSPLTNNAEFPENSLVWELNYRGNLIFMDQAKAQEQEKQLTIEDGWIYFIHGWTQVIAEVFDIEITGEKLNHCEKIAFEMR
ncbi:shikimate dehydrogenase family protein [Vallitalea sp.]|jgi:shikimate 5-dehydrogenase|uniref:shikimate dehydrogenase family protein n=1 Tax=Vallitalea sp. TaxID=1882829 RepID=UPI0025E7A3ED|nr:shikimate dehydrogenase [Vallitalea sp.]MCT4687347.1 shikimate dehydrogenase [Vallitalea sp.]